MLHCSNALGGRALSQFVRFECRGCAYSSPAARHRPT
jgi:hypothetical protein